MATLSFTLEMSESKSMELVTLAMVRRAMKVVMAEYLRLQRERIAKGVDVNGSPFVPYSDAYSSAKSRAGRRVDKPDLRLTGEMLKSQKVSVESSGSEVTGVVEFEGEHAASGLRLRGKKRGGAMVVRRTGGSGASNATIAQAVDALRPFVGVSEREKQHLMAVFKAEILRAVAESAGRSSTHARRKSG